MSNKTDKLVNRLFEANIGAYELATIYLGDRLGLYKKLSKKALSVSELAAATKTNSRYIQEWLEQQAVAGLLEVDNQDASALERRYFLSPEYAEVLVDGDNLNYLAALVRFSFGVFSGLPKLLTAFRSGEGVPYLDYGPDAREGQADTNRVMFINQLGQEWFTAIPHLHQLLQTNPTAVVADVGCGTGWSSISIAKAYPRVRVDGYDLDKPSIKLANQNAKDEKVSDRVHFMVRDAARPVNQKRYDIVTVFEAIHDMADPISALRAIKDMLKDDGMAIVVDEKVGDEFKAANPDERLFYAWSVLFCLPTSMEQQPSAATGTVMRPSTLKRYARQAGFKDIEILPVNNDLWQFYRLV